jgi:hypothetical protein
MAPFKVNRQSRIGQPSYGMWSNRYGEMCWVEVMHPKLNPDQKGTLQSKGMFALGRNENERITDVVNEGLGILFLIPPTPCKRNLGISGTRPQATNEPENSLHPKSCNLPPQPARLHHLTARPSPTTKSAPYSNPLNRRLNSSTATATIR